MDDKYFLKIAIENSIRSMDEGNFPAGAVVFKDNKVLSSEVSSPYPGLFHADSKAVSKAFQEYGPLKDATLYIGLESCLMCLGVAYWAGIRRIVYAVPKSLVSGNYYETPDNIHPLLEHFNEKVELVHMQDLEQEALRVIRKWEKNSIKKDKI